MGSSTSRSASTGVAANPRVVYNNQRRKIEENSEKIPVLDTPVLVDIQHGSIRYRYNPYAGEPRDVNKRIEQPFEGEERKTGKHDYFYHSRLKDFCGKYPVEKEEKHKLLYVSQGPASCQKKKLFYVYGIGMNAKDGQRVKPSQSKEMGRDFAWPVLRLPGNVYYKMTVLMTGDSEGNSESHVCEELEMNDRNMRLEVASEETVKDLKRQMAAKIIKPVSSIHICSQETELRACDGLKDGEWRLVARCRYISGICYIVFCSNDEEILGELNKEHSMKSLLVELQLI